MSKPIDKLYDLISSELAACSPVVLPTLCKFVQTEEGMETAREAIFQMCATQGISIKTAMSLYDTELPTPE